MEDLIILHRPRGAFEAGLPPGEIWVTWSTCVRDMAIGFRDNTKEFHLSGLDEDRFSGWTLVLCDKDAYRFCLEVVSGLHSPILGETEVLGQFKEFFHKFVFPKNPWGQKLKRFVKNILQDSKLIRETFLKNSGSQTYGSALRKKIKDSLHIACLGAGSLPESILPWFIHDIQEVSLVNRTHNDRVKNLNKKFPKIKFLAYGERPENCDVVIIAAPIESEKIVDWMSAHEVKPKLVIDFRHTSDSDHLVKNSGRSSGAGASYELITLKAFFNEIQNTQKHLKEKLSEALKFADELATLRMDEVHIRPFGWEDLCI